VPEIGMRAREVSSSFGNSCTLMPPPNHGFYIDCGDGATGVVDESVGELEALGKSLFVDDDFEETTSKRKMPNMNLLLP